MKKTAKEPTQLELLQNDSKAAYQAYRIGWAPGKKNAEYDTWQAKQALVRAEVVRITEAARAAGLVFNIQYAYSPRETANSGGRDHATLLADGSIGKLQRKAGDALCKGRRKFWGLHDLGQTEPTCKRCIAILERFIAQAETKTATK